MDNRSLENLASFNKWCKQSLEGKSIPNLLRDLSQKTIPAASDDGLSAINAVKLALRSLHGVQKHMKASDKRELSGGDAGPVPRLVHANWPRMWAWLAYLDAHCILEKKFGDTLMAASLHAIAATIAAIGWHRATRDVVIHTPGLIPTLTRHWLNEDVYVAQPELAWEAHYFAVALEHLFQYDDSDVGIVKSIIEAGGGSSVITRVSVERFRSVLKIKKIAFDTNFDAMTFYLTLIHRCSAITPSLRPSLLGQKLIPAVVQFVDFFPIHPPVMGFPPNIQQCVMACTTVIGSFLQTANGPHLIADVLDAGILKAFLRLWPSLKRIGRELDIYASKHIFDVLTDYLVYRSVLRHLGKVLKRVDQSLWDVSVTQCEPWLAFRSAASKRLDLKKEFDAQSDSCLEPGFFGCENLDCHLRSEDIPYRRCSGCHVVLYCSNSCQKTDWPKHRAICKADQKSIREQSRPIISRHDRHFIHFIMIKDVGSYLASARLHIKEKYPTSPVSALNVELIYIGTHTTSVSLAAEHVWDDDEKVEMETLLRRAREDKDRRVLVNAVVREGYSLTDGPMARRYPLVAYLDELDL